MKLICFDLDGTLLCDDKSITEENKIALENARNAGNKLAIVTGRSLRGSRMIIEELDFVKENCYVISFQGNLVFDLFNDSFIYDAGVESKKIISLLKDLEAHNIYAHTFDYKHIIAKSNTIELEKYNRIAKEEITFLSSWDELKDKTYPKVIAIEYENTKKLYEYQEKFMQSEAYSDFDCFFSSPYFLEFCKKNSNKGTGVKALADYLGLSAKDVIAIGDERNDIPMLQYAGIGCAMTNGHSETKASADYITQNDNNNSGVAEIIYKHVI